MARTEPQISSRPRRHLRGQRGWIPGFARPPALVALLLFVLLVPRTAGAGFLATLEVDTVANSVNWFDGKCSLREAIANVNSSGAGGMVAGECEAGDGLISNEIVFDPAVFGSGGTIALSLGSGVLPSITRSFTTIDGWSAGGDGYTGPPLVTIDGTGLAAATETIRGLHLQAAGITVRGLAITGFWPASGGGRGIDVDGADCRIQASYVGLEADGSTPSPNRSGVTIGSQGSGTLLGTDADGTNDEAESNVVVDGVSVYAEATIAGNLIGTDASGLVALTGKTIGVDVSIGGAYEVLVGGPSQVERNVIAGYTNQGIRVDVSSSTIRARIVGNYIGTDVTGNAALPNYRGIYASGPVSGVSIEQNVISGNTWDAVELTVCSIPPCSSPGGGNRIVGNTVGLGADGTTTLPNDVGIEIENSSDNLVAGNLVSGNATAGVIVRGEESQGNGIIANWIGPTATAAATSSVQPVGVDLSNEASNNSIADNLLVGNLIQISFQAFGTGNVDDNRIVHNRLGSGPTGAYVTGQTVGIELAAGTGNLVADNDLRFCERGIVLAGSGVGAKVFRNQLTLNDGFAAVELSDFAELLPGSTHNCIEANASVDDDVSNLTGFAVVFEDNWWGDSSGPSGLGPGTGESVSADIDFDPWLASRPLCGFAGDVSADGFESGDLTGWDASAP